MVCCTPATPTPSPETGWQYNDGATWHHGAGLRVTRVEDISTLLCGTITVSATGEAARFQSKGKFRPTGQFSAGRQVFYNKRTRRYLSVYPCSISWGSRYNVEDNEIGVRSGCAPGELQSVKKRRSTHGSTIMPRLLEMWVWNMILIWNKFSLLWGEAQLCFPYVYL